MHKYPRYYYENFVYFYFLISAEKRPFQNREQSKIKKSCIENEHKKLSKSWSELFVFSVILGAALHKLFRLSANKNERLKTRTRATVARQRANVTHVCCYNSGNKSLITTRARACPSAKAKIKCCTKSCCRCFCCCCCSVFVFRFILGVSRVPR